MSPDEYRTLRQRLGTQVEVAKLLGVHYRTLSKRERGEISVSPEAEIALRCLLEHRGPCVG